MCGYCEGKHHVLAYDDSFETVEVFIVCDKLCVDFHFEAESYSVNTSTPIKYCPMCGRKLGGEA